MGSWGIKALESDQGLDVVEFLVAQYKDEEKLVLSKIIAKMLKDGFFVDDRENIDYYYDSSAKTLAELIVLFMEEGTLSPYLENVKSFVFDKKPLNFILQYLLDMKDEKPDEDGDREYVYTFKGVEGWSAYLDTLILKLKEAISKL